MVKQTSTQSPASKKTTKTRSDGSEASPVKKSGESLQKDATMQRTFGLILVLLGGFFLLQTFVGFELIGKLWPLILVLVGLAILFGRGRRS